MIYVPAPHPDSFRGMPVVAQMPPHAMYFIPDQLRLKIMSQIDYYFRYLIVVCAAHDWNMNYLLPFSCLWGT